MQHSSFRKLKWPLLSSILFFVLALGTFLYLYRDMGKVKSMLEENELAWQMEAVRREEIDSLNRSLKEIEPKKILFDPHFLTDRNVVPFLNMIDTLAPKAGANVEVVSADLENNAGLMVEMRAQGRFGQVYKFLKLLETSPYELEFVSADMYKASITDAKGAIVPAGWQGIFKVKVLTFVP